MTRIDTAEGRRYVVGDTLLRSVTDIIGDYYDIYPKDEEGLKRWAELAERGTRIHALIAHPPETREAFDALTVAEQNGLIGWHRFVDDWRFKPEDSELQLADVDLGYGGTPDHIGRIPGGRVIVDVKTGAKRERMLFLQLGAYYGLYHKAYPRRKVCGAVGVYLDLRTGGYSAAPVSLTGLREWFNEFMGIKEEVCR